MPLHPALVHLPLGLAMLLPLLGVAALIALWRSPAQRHLWIAYTVGAVLMAGSAYAGLQTGEDEEEIVESVVSKTLIHEHEELAELFMILAAVVAVLALLTLIAQSKKPSATMVLGGLAVLVSVAALVQGLRTGHAGGELVYVHNAGAAYLNGAAPVQGAKPGAEAKHEEGDEH
jgi:formate hydrogenlyase subunit 3/multisubunit Na+/H+ antiporter MnhD subunit